VRTLALALAALLPAAAAAQAQEPPPDPSDVVNALLSGLLGVAPVSEQELRQEVEQAGGIRFLHDVPLDYLTHAQLSSYLAELLDAEYPPEKADADARTLRALDLLPGGTPLRELRRRLLLENVIGFYDDRPGRQRLYAVSADRSLTPVNQLVLAHELRHALQDQYASIHDLLGREVSDFDDRSQAVLSVLEGDATLLMERFLARKLGAPGEGLGSGLTLPSPEMPGTPAVLRDQMVTPYLAGLEFVRALQAAGGWDAVREAWQRPPASMEQVLHPEKFASREIPLLVEREPAPEAARPLSEGVLGEAFLGTLLDEDVLAAQGWGGDRYQSWDVGGRTLLVWRSLWDSDEARRRFGQALIERFSRHRQRDAEPVAAGWVVFAEGSWRFAILDAADGVVLVSSDDVGLLRAAVARITARRASS